MKVYLNLKSGFVGTSLIDGEFIGNASYYDKILIFKKKSYIIKILRIKLLLIKII